MLVIPAKVVFKEAFFLVGKVGREGRGVIVGNISDL